ncbi:MAG TPA: lytic transglycosylase domain-containing protein [Anaeromyxobacteraceae bacterium]|nr:lytic transglycosylase domain-containing protein [Anaeromyxobacteraceae bacterium]
MHHSHQQFIAIVSAAIAFSTMAGLGCASTPPRSPRPPWEEWAVSAEPEVEEPLAEAAVEDPFPEISTDLLLPSEALARAPAPGRDARFLTVESHVSRRMRGGREADSTKVAEAVLKAADWAGVDPVLVLAMIEVESGFDPSARSSQGARGLMQVRPATLWAQAARSGLAGEDPHAPELNVPAGVLYFRRLLDTFGNKYLALVAYNAGPNRLSGLLRSGGIPDRFREYPRRVFAAEERLRRSLQLASQ